MCGVTRSDKIRNEHIRVTTRVVQASKEIREKMTEVRRMKGAVHTYCEECFMWACHGKEEDGGQT